LVLSLLTHDLISKIPREDQDVIRAPLGER
jgi:hypothetical protein